MPHFKGQLIGTACVARLGKGHARQAARPRGEAIIKAINEHTDELKEREQG